MSETGNSTPGTAAPPPGLPPGAASAFRRATLSASVMVLVEGVGLLPIEFRGGGNLNTDRDLSEILQMLGDNIAQRLQAMGMQLRPQQVEDRGERPMQGGQQGEQYPGAPDAVVLADANLGTPPS